MPCTGSAQLLVDQRAAGNRAHADQLHEAVGEVQHLQRAGCSIRALVLIGDELLGRDQLRSAAARAEQRQYCVCSAVRTRAILVGVRNRLSATAQAIMLTSSLLVRRDQHVGIRRVCGFGGSQVQTGTAAVPDVDGSCGSASTSARRSTTVMSLFLGGLYATELPTNLAPRSDLHDVLTESSMTGAGRSRARLIRLVRFRFDAEGAQLRYRFVRSTPTFLGWRATCHSQNCCCR